ncbi:MAG: hypothetical protein P1U34_07700 [Coxiellaceae bacterium]|nr:hypothetical protein [Coxiellaceae bacterium]
MQRIIILFALSVLFSINLQAASIAKFSDKVIDLPDIGTANSQQYAGYASTTQNCIPNKCPNAPSLYYWLITATNDYKNKPLIIWFNGGPGSSSMYGPFMETGPYQFNRAGKIAYNNNTWTQFANYMIIEQPLGIGASVANNFALPSNNKQSSEQFYKALQNIVKLHPFLAKQKIYLAGESYAGTMLPYIAIKMQRANNSNIKLGGLILNDIWVNPIVQQSYDTKYAYAHGMISVKQKHAINKLYKNCAALIKQQTPSSVAANTACAKIKTAIQNDSGLYMLNMMGVMPNYKPITTYLSRTDVQEALHMKPQDPYPLFSTAISKLFTPGLQDSVVGLYKTLLNNRTPIIMMSGLLDATDCNFLGMDAMIQTINWSSLSHFNKAKIKQWQDNDQAKTVLGYIQVGGGLTRVKVLNGGHMLPLDQPKVGRLVNQFINGKI